MATKRLPHKFSGEIVGYLPDAKSLPVGYECYSALDQSWHKVVSPAVLAQLYSKRDNGLNIYRFKLVPYRDADDIINRKYYQLIAIEDESTNN